MANQKVTELTALTTPAMEDLALLVDDPGGTPISKSATLAVIDALFRANDQLFIETANAVLANSNAETSIIGTGVGSLTLPAGFFSVGKSVRLTAFGFISTTGTPTITIKFKLGAVTICATAAITTASGLATALLAIDLVLTCRTIGATGTVIAAGQVGVGTVVGGLYPTSGAVSVVDTTGTLAASLTGQWSAADPANTLTITNLILTELN